MIHTPEPRPATSSRPGRAASPHRSSLGAGWHLISTSFRRFNDRWPVDWSDIAGLLALIAMIWPFIL